MHKICVTIWEIVEWPKDWTDSLFIPLQKKGDHKQCTNSGTTTLVLHSSKLIVRIILERIRLKTKKKIAIEQAEFRPGRGTRDQISNLRLLLEKAHGHQRLAFMYFVDFKKPFDLASHGKLWATMKDIGYPLHLSRLLAQLYRKQNAEVNIASTLSESFHIQKSVRQRCAMSPYLFNIMTEIVMRETLDDFMGGI